MRVWVYVEGESDKLGLDALWRDWKSRLRMTGWSIRFIPLGGKPKYFKYIGQLAAEKLRERETDLVVGLPDLYPRKRAYQPIERPGSIRPRGAYGFSSETDEWHPRHA